MKLDNKHSPKSIADNNVNGHDVESKFELISCPLNGKNCKNHLISINRNFIESNIYHKNKEYQQSIEALNNAFTETLELNEETCAKCAETFRFSIIQMLQNIHVELGNTTKGLLKTNRYKSSYILADNVLHSFKNKGI